VSDAPFPGFEPPEANFTPVPNAFFDCVLGHYPLRVVTVVGILIRSTLGWQDKVTGEKRLERELPLRAFVRPELSENSARQGLREAIAAGLVIETAPHTNRDGARYALRWADENMLLDRIARQRRAAGDGRAFGDPAEARERAARRLAAGGTKSGPPKSGPPKSGGPTSAPLLKKRFPEKKPFLNGLKKPLNVGTAPDAVPALSGEHRPSEATPNAGEKDAYSTLVADGVRQALALTGTRTAPPASCS
jgi:hypothetical protein